MLRGVPQQWRREEWKRYQPRRHTVPASANPESMRGSPDQLEQILALVAQYVEASPDVAQAVIEVNEDLKECAREICHIGRSHSSLELLEYVRFTQTVRNPNTYEESSDRGATALVELVALALISGPTSSNHVLGPSTDYSLPEAVERVLELGSRLVELVVLRNLLSGLEAGESRDTLAAIAQTRELFVRSPTYEHIVERTLNKLFGTPDMEQLCRDTLGFTVREAYRLFLAIEERCNMAVRVLQNRLGQLNEDLELLVSTSGGADALIDELRGLPEGTISALRDQFDRVWFPIPQESTFGPADIASATELPIDIVLSFLEVFEYTPTVADAGDFIEAVIGRPSPLRTQPILRDGDHRRFLVHSGLGIHSIREAVEAHLKATTDSAIYWKHRSAFLEQESMGFLTRILPTARVHRNLKYLGPRPKSHEKDGCPKDYSAIFEADGLLIVDDVAIVVEAKSGGIRPDARGGASHELSQDLRKLVTAASAQTKRLHDLVLKDHGVQLRDHSWLDLSAVREVHSIVVSLEDLSGLATSTAELLERNLLPEAHLPWLVSLHDLHIIGDLIQHVAEFVLYLRRRTNPEIIGLYHAVDELDYFMAFLVGGLTSEHQPVWIRDGDPVPNQIDIRLSDSDSADSIRVLTTHTDMLDAWYLYQRGVRTKPTPRPSLETHSEIRSIVDLLEQLQQPGWLSIGVALLDRDESSQQGIVACIAEMVGRTRQDGRNHTACIVRHGQASESSTLIFCSVGDASIADAEMNHLAGYVTAKKYQMRTAIGAGILFDTQEPLLPKRSIYDNRKHEPDAELDRLAESYGLDPVNDSDL